MTASALMAAARARGIILIPHRDQLRCLGPVRAMTPNLLESLRAHRIEILAELLGPDSFKPGLASLDPKDGPRTRPGSGRAGSRGFVLPNPVDDADKVWQAKFIYWPEEMKELWHERAAILEFDAGLPRAEAERRAFRIVADGVKAFPERILILRDGIECRFTIRNDFVYVAMLYNGHIELILPFVV
jgi:hypothetical protein